MSAPAAVNRANRLHEVLRDGRVHSRDEIFHRAGFMLTNNAASELRDQLESQGLGVVHTVEHRVDCYQVVRLEKVEEGAARPGECSSVSGTLASSSTSSHHHDETLEQLSLDAA